MTSLSPVVTQCRTRAIQRSCSPSEQTVRERLRLGLCVEIMMSSVYKDMLGECYSISKYNHSCDAKWSFYLTGAVSNTSALFTYDSEYLLETYYNVSRHDASFVPVFTVPDSPDDPLANETSKICSGEGSEFCR